MRFLHEYNVPSNGPVSDNGYWVIRNGYVENARGGRHRYEPSPDDEIVAYDSWESLYKHTVRDDSQITGWIAPNGEFFGCKPEDHDKMCTYYFGARNELALEKMGYIKIFENPWRLRAMKPELPHYDYGWATVPTAAQWDTLIAKGVVEDRDYYDKWRGASV